jgi:hypothetical protein
MTIPVYSPYKETSQKKVLSAVSQRLSDGVHIAEIFAQDRSEASQRFSAGAI